MSARRLEVGIPGSLATCYPVWIGCGVLDRLSEDLSLRGWVLVTDDHVGPLYGDRVEASIRAAGAESIRIQVAPGEHSKVRATVDAIQDRALAAGAGRDWGVVALGGGVIGDLAGYAAATLVRGIACVQIPTSLLAMVDSAVGGKTGVDTPAGKNLIGAFHQPRAVYADISTLETLPDRQLRAGLAEVIKYGVIADEQLFIDLDDGLLESCLDRVPEALIAVIECCLKIKAGVVAADEREGGLREILNFGHTVAHGIEVAAGYSLLHGEAVAVGMVAEARLAEAAFGAEPGIAATIASLCERAGLPSRLPPAIEAEAVLTAARTDKKSRAGKLRCALPTRIGAMATDAGRAGAVEVDATALLAAVAAS